MQKCCRLHLHFACYIPYMLHATCCGVNIETTNFEMSDFTLLWISSFTCEGEERISDYKELHASQFKNNK